MKEINNVFEKKTVQIWFFVSMCFLIALLFFEYCSLVNARLYLQELKDEYYVGVYEVKKILSDYRATKERLACIESMLRYEDGVSLVSAQELWPADNENFVIINRDADYLKQQAKEYIENKGLMPLFKQLSEDVWIDYNDIALMEKKPQPMQSKKVVAKKPTRKVLSSSKAKSGAQLFSWPIERSRFWLSSLYGRRKNANGTWGFHRAIDMAALKGTPVLAAASGVVIEAKVHRGYGKTIVIRHNNKYKTRYAHLNALHVTVGQKVNRGMHIGDVGDTGLVRKTGKDASHLHFELYVFGERVNPLYYLA